MPELAIDYPRIADLTESGSAALRDRLAKKYELGDSVEQEEVEGGPAAMVRRTVLLNQLDSSMPWDGRINNLFNNCGPSCCSMVLHHVTGRRMWPDEIVDWMRGENHEGYTSVEDQVNFLKAHGVPCEAVQASDLSEFRSILREQVEKGRLSIVLVYFDWSKKTGGHFEVVYLADEDDVEVGCLNPWKGTYLKTSWEKLWANTKNGRLILIKASGKESGEKSYTELKENWNAVTKTDVNVRSGPSTRYSVVKVIKANTKLYLSKYTDQGQAVKGSEPERRWHYSERAGGWLFDGGLHKFERP
ncbi:MAG: hypothetical protein M3Q29_15180 [Chloroflexota bacterium]|nr:hypothetical protein [Chloroflexota bacterium]